MATIVAHQEGIPGLAEPLVYDQRVQDATYYMGRRFDGRGREGGLSGQELPLAARILAVAHTFVTDMERGQGKADNKAIVNAIRHQVGTWYDPQIVQALVDTV